MLTLIIEFGRQRRKFDLKYPINIDQLGNEIKSSFRIDEQNRDKYIIQVYNEKLNDYFDFTPDIHTITDNTILRGQLVPRQWNSFQFQPKVTKQQVVGLVTLESIENSLEQWSKLLQNIQAQITKELETVRETIVAVKSHYKIVDELNIEDDCSAYPVATGSRSPLSVSQTVNSSLSPILNCNANNSPVIRPSIDIPPEVSSRSHSAACHNQQHRGSMMKNGRRGISNRNIFAKRGNSAYYPPSQVPSRPIEYNVPIVVTYQRFPPGVAFQAHLSKYYNPSYFFLHISNQTESYDEMHRDINEHYNSMDINQSFIPRSGEFCVAKSPNDPNWYRARVIRLMGHEKAELLYIDTGEIAEVSRNLIQPLLPQFSDRPAQALACTLAEVLPFSQNERCGWSRRACMSLENVIRNERSLKGKNSMNATVADNRDIVWPMMFIHASTATISNLSEHMCDLYLSRRCSNLEISEYWSTKIRPEQYVFFNLSSIINQKQFFIFNDNNDNESGLSLDEAIDLISKDLGFFSR